MTPTLRERVETALAARSPSRDHPFHAALVTGRLDRPALRAFAEQQWHFHRGFPQVLSELACSAQGTPRAAATRDTARAQDTACATGPLARWERVCADLGLDVEALTRSPRTAATIRLLAVQAATARTAHEIGCPALMIGVYAEAAPYLEARRAAFATSYGVGPEALAYFGNPAGDLALPTPAAVLAAVDPPAAVHADLLAHLEAVLAARWDYFTALTHSLERS